LWRQRAKGRAVAIPGFPAARTALKQNAYIGEHDDCGDIGDDDFVAEMIDDAQACPLRGSD
jgi:hypothetical protein